MARSCLRVDPRAVTVRAANHSSSVTFLSFVHFSSVPPRRPAAPTMFQRGLTFLAAIGVRLLHGRGRGPIPSDIKTSYHVLKSMYGTRPTPLVSLMSVRVRHVRHFGHVSMEGVARRRALPQTKKNMFLFSKIRQQTTTTQNNKKRLGD